MNSSTDCAQSSSQARGLPLLGLTALLCLVATDKRSRKKAIIELDAELHGIKANLGVQIDGINVGNSSTFFNSVVNFRDTRLLKLNG